MDLQLHNKLALVTASSGGIGLAIAETLAAEGARVIINGRSEGTVSSAIAQLSNKLPEARFYPWPPITAPLKGRQRPSPPFPRWTFW
jgi:3-oxoacyl-[acyl-carrier protein] reductase